MQRDVMFNKPSFSIIDTSCIRAIKLEMEMKMFERYKARLVAPKMQTKIPSTL